jgi:restriction endonuclease S subunit
MQKEKIHSASINQTNLSAGQVDHIPDSLPPGWKRVKLEDLLDYVQPTDYIVESTEYKDSYKTPVLTPGKSFIKGYTNERKGIYTDLPVIIFDDFTTANKFVNFPFKVKSSAMKILKPKIGSSIKFVFYFMQTLKVSTDTHKRYWISVYSKLRVPLPPLPTQHLIVTKIEELFSELDKGIELLKLAQQQLKVYRQAVLKSAFEGKLTESYRKSDGQDKVKNHSVSKNQVNHSADNLPEGWKWVKLGEITTVLGDGLHGTPKYFENGEYYFINGNNLVDGKIVLKQNTKRVHADEYEKYRKPLNDKTILVSINGSIGYTAFYNDEKVILGKSACYFNVIDSIDKHYVRYNLLSNKFLKYAEDNATGSTIKNVGLKAMRAYSIPIPASLNEQKEIVQQIESRLSVADKMEESINDALKQSEALRQSILKSAFEGRLVSENESEEELLPIAAEPLAAYESYVVEKFPVSIQGITTTDLHAGVLALVIDAHEKSPEHKGKISRVKGEKIAHMVEAHLGIDLGRVPVKDAAGPDDYRHLMKVESRAKKANWFEPIKAGKVGHTYQARHGLNKINNLVMTKLSDTQFKDIEDMIRLFLPMDLEQSEIVATLYAGWNNLLLQGNNPTDEEIVYESRENWSKRKLTIDRERFWKALNWMRKKGLVPVGRGKEVMALKKSKSINKSLKS